MTPSEWQFGIIDVAATGNEDGEVFLSIVNKHPDKDVELDIYLEHAPSTLQCVAVFEIYHPDLHASNTKEHPQDVVIQPAARAQLQKGRWVFSVKKHSINLLQFKGISIG